MSNDRKPQRRDWIVCESGGRWRQSVWSFAPQWLTNDESLVVTSAAATEVATYVQRFRRGVLFWELNDDDLLSGNQNRAGDKKLVSQRIASLGADRDAWLQVIAVARLSSHDRCALSEMGIAAFIRNPEDLPRLQRMVSGHFARSAGLLH